MGEIIVDPEPLDFFWLPPALVGRERELKLLDAMYHDVAKNNECVHMFITGESGLGKTALVRLFFDQLVHRHDDVDVTYINCKRHNSAYAVGCEVLRTHEKGSCPSTLNEVNEDIKRKLERNQRSLVVVLDEAHVLFDDKKNAADREIYVLSRINDCIAGKKVSLSVVLVSPKDMLKILTKSTAGLFEPNVLDLGPYRKATLCGIVEQRSKLALASGSIDEDGIEFIARITENGNARMAIEILRKSAKLAENEGAAEIYPEAIRLAKKDETMMSGTSFVFDLSLDEKYALLAVAHACRKRLEVTVKDAYNTYGCICEEQEDEGKGYKQFTRYASKLAGYGLIGVRSAAKISYAYIETSAEDMIDAVEELVSLEKSQAIF